MFLTLARNFDKVDLAGLPGWLKKVARHRVLDHLRRQSQEVLSDPPEPESGWPSPEDTARSREMAAAVREGLSHVAAPRREVLVAVALEDRSLAEVAREQGISPDTAQSRHDAAEKDLRAVMERGRASEKRMSKGFTSWAAMWAILDWRARVVAWMTRAKALLVKAWPKVLAFAGAVTGIGVIVAGLSGAPPAAPDVVVGLPAVAIDAPVLTSKLAVPMAPHDADRSAAPARVAPALGSRRRHNEHVFFEAQRFGTKRP